MTRPAEVDEPGNILGNAGRGEYLLPKVIRRRRRFIRRRAGDDSPPSLVPSITFSLSRIRGSGVPARSVRAGFVGRLSRAVQTVLENRPTEKRRRSLVSPRRQSDRAGTPAARETFVPRSPGHYSSLVGSGYSPGTTKRSSRRSPRSKRTSSGWPTGSCVNKRCKSSTLVVG